MWRLAAEYLFFAAVMVAARPYLEFLIMPPEGDGEKWAVTIIALGAALALRLFIRQRGEQERLEVEARAEEQRRERMEGR